MSSFSGGCNEDVHWLRHKRSICMFNPIGDFECNGHLDEAAGAADAAACSTTNRWGASDVQINYGSQGDPCDPSTAASLPPLRLDCCRVKQTSSPAEGEPAEVQRLFTAHFIVNYQPASQLPWVRRLALSA